MTLDLAKTVLFFNQ